MPLIASGASGAVSVPKGYLLALMAGAVGTVGFGPGPAARQSPVAIIGQALVLGPFPDVQTVYLTSASGQIAYSLQRADGLVPSLVPSSPFKLSPLILEQNNATQTPLTGTTTKTTLASILVPAGLVGLNGSLRVSALASCTNSANTKTLTFELAGSTLNTQTATTVASLFGTALISNRGSLSSQIARVYSPGGGGSFNTSAVNTAVDQILTISGQLALGSETMTLESYLVEVLPG